MREDLRSYTLDLYKSYHLCENHFEESKLKNKDNKKAGIICYVVQTLFNVTNPPPKVTPTTGIRLTISDKMLSSCNRRYTV